MTAAASQLLGAAALLLLPLAATGVGSGALPVPQVIVLAPGASAVETLAAQELARLLQPLMADNSSAVPILPSSAAPQFAVGYGAAMAMGAMGWNGNGTAPSTADPFARLSNDSFAILSAHCDLPAGQPRCNLPLPAASYAGSVAITGRAQGARGTLYGVYEMLRRFLGVQFLAADATVYPDSKPTTLPVWNLTFTPSYEYRDILGWPVMNDPVFAAQLGLNGPSAFGSTGRKIPNFSLQPVEYASPPGFVHTALRLLDDVNGTHGATANVPPALRAAHPEWFSLDQGKPCAKGGDPTGTYLDGCQLCWSDPGLQEYLLSQVKLFLRASPNVSTQAISLTSWINQAPECVFETLLVMPGHRALHLEYG